ncbi:MAG: TIGR00730 family Rossman fold protein [Acidobacteria bacterium]|nr:TIGR00730 family Rossman fold protein [Acidobacteriota bacterium]
MLRRICVFCGSNSGVRPVYKVAAENLGRLLAERGIGLVYGGADVGLMGAVANAALASRGEVIGVIPRMLVDKEIAHRGLSTLEVVDSMQERKQRMADLSDGFISLPGALGTLDELFEMATWAQLGLEPKPNGLLNIAGYYDSLLAFLDHATNERFLRPQHRELIIAASDPERMLARMDAFRMPEESKWFPTPRT